MDRGPTDDLLITVSGPYGHKGTVVRNWSGRPFAISYYLSEHMTRINNFLLKSRMLIKI